MGGFWKPIEAKLVVVAELSVTDDTVPEYAQSPAAHLNNPTTIKINGKTPHCDTELRAGQRKAARGYVGRFPAERTDAVELVAAEEVPLSIGAFFLTFRRGL